MINNQASVKKVFTIALSLETFIIIWSLCMAALRDDRPSLYFDEGSIITWLSCFQLLSIAFLSRKIEQSRKEQLRSNRSKKSLIIWRIITISFIFLAVDEVLLLHERFDSFIHYLLHFEETPLTDRLDDIIVLGYGIVGLFILYIFRREIKNYKKAFPILSVSIFLIIIMSAIDAMNQSSNDLAIFIADPEDRKLVYKYLGPIEEMFKIWAEGMLITFFYCCWKISTQSLARKRIQWTSSAKQSSQSR